MCKENRWDSIKRLSWTVGLLWMLSAFIGQGPVSAMEEKFDHPEGGIPAGWKAISLEPVVENPDDYETTRYTMVGVDGRTALQATADSSASSLLWETEFNPQALPILEWEWKVSRTLPHGDLTDTSREDAPARMIVMFPFDREKSNVVERVAYNQLREVFGKFTPGEMIIYAWSNRLPKGNWIESPYTRRVQILSVESGNGHVGKWMGARRNIAEDYRRQFGKPAPDRAWLGIMVDTDDTQSLVISWFDSILLSPKPPPNLQAAQKIVQPKVSTGG